MEMYDQQNVMKLACCITYGGDGRLSNGELSALMDLADVIVEKDEHDRELAKKECVLHALDIFRESFENPMYDTAEKKRALLFELANASAQKLKLAVDDKLSKESEKINCRTVLMDKFKSLAQLNGYGDDEKKLIKIISKGIGEITIVQVLIALGILSLFLYGIYWVISLIF